MNGKKIGAIALALLMALGVILTPACAASFEEMEPEIQPFAVIPGDTAVPWWSYISTIHPALTASGNTLYPEVSVVAQNSDSSITGTMYLEEEVDTDDWDSVKSWAIQGTGIAVKEGSYSGDDGTTYRVRVKVWVGGESAEVYSNEVTL